MQIADFLTRLRGVSEEGAGKWIACCPAHDKFHKEHPEIKG